MAHLPSPPESSPPDQTARRSRLAWSLLTAIVLLCGLGELHAGRQALGLFMLGSALLMLADSTIGRGRSGMTLGEIDRDIHLHGRRPGATTWALRALGLALCIAGAVVACSQGGS